MAAPLSFVCLLVARFIGARGGLAPADQWAAKELAAARAQAALEISNNLFGGNLGGLGPYYHMEKKKEKNKIFFTIRVSHSKCKISTN